MDSGKGGISQKLKDGVTDGDSADLKQVIPNTDSDRVLVVKRAIVRALSELMDEKDFKNISVGDILERSGISRSTFYRYFADKYEVVNWSYMRYRHIRLQDRALHYSFESSLQVQLRYIADQQRYFAHALRYVGQNSLRDFMYESLEEYMAKCWHEAHGSNQPDYAVRARIQFAASGAGKIIEKWVIDGCEQDTDEVAEVIISLIPATLLGVLNP